jgi:hypothetical protein
MVVVQKIDLAYLETFRRSFDWATSRGRWWLHVMTNSCLEVSGGPCVEVQKYNDDYF